MNRLSAILLVFNCKISGCSFLLKLTIQGRRTTRLYCSITNLLQLQSVWRRSIVTIGLLTKMWVIHLELLTVRKNYWKNVTELWWWLILYSKLRYKMKYYIYQGPDCQKQRRGFSKEILTEAVDNDNFLSTYNSLLCFQEFSLRYFSIHLGSTLWSCSARIKGSLTVAGLLGHVMFHTITSMIPVIIHRRWMMIHPCHVSSVVSIISRVILMSILSYTSLRMVAIRIRIGMIPTVVMVGIGIPAIVLSHILSGIKASWWGCRTESSIMVTGGRARHTFQRRENWSQIWSGTLRRYLRHLAIRRTMRIGGIGWMSWIGSRHRRVLRCPGIRRCSRISHSIGRIHAGESLRHLFYWVEMRLGGWAATRWRQQRLRRYLPRSGWDSRFLSRSRRNGTFLSRWGRRRLGFRFAVWFFRWLLFSGLHSIFAFCVNLLRFHFCPSVLKPHLQKKKKSWFSSDCL